MMNAPDGMCGGVCEAERTREDRAEPDFFADDFSDCGESGLLTVPEECAGRRLDVFVSESTGLTRSAVRRLIDGGSVLVGGMHAKPGSSVRAGELISVSIPPPAVTELVPQDIPIDIVYEDDDIAVVNKPVGMVVHPAPGNPDGTLVNALMYRLGGLSGIGGELRPGIVHRIDKDTSGLLVAAKNDAAHNALAEQLRTHSMRRTYFALCEGNLREDSGTVDAPIGRCPTDRKRMAVITEARGVRTRTAVTHWRVLERFGSVTLLRAELETGRTHQIRVHLSYIKHPLVGDAVYGSGRNSLGFVGQALHAGELRLVHPRTGEPMTFTAELPEAFKNALEILRREHS